MYFHDYQTKRFYNSLYRIRDENEEAMRCENDVRMNLMQTDCQSKERE